MPIDMTDEHKHTKFQANRLENEDAGNIFLGTPEGRLRPTLILCIKLVHKMHEIGRNRKKTERKKHVFLSLLSHFSIKFNENSFVKTCLDGLSSQRVVSLKNAPKMAQWRRRSGAFMTSG